MIQRLAYLSALRIYLTEERLVSQQETADMLGGKIFAVLGGKIFTMLGHSKIFAVLGGKIFTMLGHRR